MLTVVLHPVHWQLLWVYMVRSKAVSYGLVVVLRLTSWWWNRVSLICPHSSQLSPRRAGKRTDSAALIQVPSDTVSVKPQGDSSGSSWREKSGLQKKGPVSPRWAPVDDRLWFSFWSSSSRGTGWFRSGGSGDAADGAGARHPLFGSPQLSGGHPPLNALQVQTSVKLPRTQGNTARPHTEKQQKCGDETRIRLKQRKKPWWYMWKLFQTWKIM